MKFTKWALNVSTKLGNRYAYFQSHYRDTAKKNAGKRLTKMVRGMGYGSVEEAVRSIQGATLSNGVFNYELANGAVDGSNWTWREIVGPGM